MPEKLIEQERTFMIDRTQIEDGIWPLVLAANKAGYPTISSCEGHYDQRRASIVFVADVGSALRVHTAIRDIFDDLLCNWEMSAHFLNREGEYVLAWILENWSVKSDTVLDEPEFWETTTEVGRIDVPRLADLFASLNEDSD